jgi:hypothetical protein
VTGVVFVGFVVALFTDGLFVHQLSLCVALAVWSEQIGAVASVGAKQHTTRSSSDHHANAMEYTLALIKPDAVGAGKAAEIQQLAELAGFSIIAKRSMQVLLCCMSRHTAPEPPCRHTCAGDRTDRSTTNNHLACARS